MKSRNLYLLIPVMFIFQFLATQGLPKMERKLDRLFQKTMNKQLLKQGVFRLESKALDLEKSWAFGQFKNGQKVVAESPFHTASLGKTFTTVVIALLVEEGKIEFDSPMHHFLPDTLAQGLHIWEGKDWTKEITLAHLLQHRSGLSDYFEDRPSIGENMLKEILHNRDKFWSPKEILDFYTAGFQARFAPGTDYHYTDTEYVLLGLIIEELEKKPLHEVFEERIFTPLGLASTSMHLRSAPRKKPVGPMTEIYFGDLEVSRMSSLSSD